MNRSALWLTFPPRYTNSYVWLYTWPAAYTLNTAVDSDIPFARKYMISVLVSDTTRPNAAHTTTITPIIFLSCSGDCEMTPASSECSYDSPPQTADCMNQKIKNIHPYRRPNRKKKCVIDLCLQQYSHE